MRRRTLTDEDVTAWASYARHVSARPGVPAPPAPPAPTPSLSPALAPEPVAVAVQLRTRPGAVSIGIHPAGVDGGTWTRFRTGKLGAVRTLDLHGRTADAAHRALGAFLRTAHADGVRCVEVITGRGSGTEGGVIRRELPHWLNATELRPLLLAAAHPHALNPGSVRVLLRRVRGR